MVQNLDNNLDSESETSGDEQNEDEDGDSDLDDGYVPLSMGLTAVGNPYK